MPGASSISIFVGVLLVGAVSCSDSRSVATSPSHCPAPQPGVTCAAGKVWAREDASGLCCEYDSSCTAPLDWKTYATAAQCNPLGCSCDRSAGAAPQPIGCACPLSGCPTLTDMLAAPCSPDAIPLFERRGCGKVELSFSGGFTGSGSVFDEASGKLLGQSEFSDVEYGVCSTFEYTFGADFDCADVTSECSHCGVSTLPDSPPACPD